MREINEQCAEGESCTNKNSTVGPMVSRKNKYQINYFLAGLEKDADMKTSAVITQGIHNKLVYS